MLNTKHPLEEWFFSTVGEPKLHKRKGKTRLTMPLRGHTARIHHERKQQCAWGWKKGGWSRDNCVGSAASRSSDSSLASLTVDELEEHARISNEARSTSRLPARVKHQTNRESGAEWAKCIQQDDGRQGRWGGHSGCGFAKAGARNQLPIAWHRVQALSAPSESWKKRCGECTLASGHLHAVGHVKKW